MNKERVSINEDKIRLRFLVLVPSMKLAREVGGNPVKSHVIPFKISTVYCL